MNMNTIINRIPAAFRHKLLTSADALLNSKWCRMVKDPAVQSVLLEQAEKWLCGAGKKLPVAEPLGKAVRRLRELHESNQLWSTGNILVLAAAVLYTLSLPDAVPDVLPCIGWLDDIAVLLGALRYICGSAPATAAAPGAELPEAGENV